MQDDGTIEKAAQWTQENKERILKKIVTEQNPRNAKECIFMAGSPGAGKTETVRRLKLKETFTILEADEIRVLNPHYQKTTETQKGNAHLIQKAASIGLEYCRKYCIENGMVFVQDTTFSNRGSIDLVRKLTNAGWDMTIIFIYQDPEKAWQFTKAREEIEGRNIPKESFAESFTGIIRNIERVQGKHPDMRVILAIKDGTETVERVKLEHETITSALKERDIVMPDKNAILQAISR